MPEHKIIHATFEIERKLAAPAAKVWQAFANKQAKEAWFVGPVANGDVTHEMDFRVGGKELNRGTFKDGVVHIFKATYYDIVPENRIVYAYEMYLGEQRISVSLATIELTPEGDGTKLVLHESGAFLDGFDKPEIRGQGTRMLLDALEKSLA